MEDDLARMGQASRRQGQAEEERFKRLLDVGSMVFSELDLEAVLRSVLEAARDLTGAEFAALGVLDRDRKELERFLYLGIDEEARRAIGALPRGRGVLGELLRSPTHMRLRDVGEHPRAHGFPAGHPPMRSFLGVPIAIRGEAFGSLYMAEKRDAGEFDEADEDAARTLAAWAGVAIENARLYTSLSEREADLQQQIEIGRRERRQWAQELHDDALQAMAAIRISLAVALRSKAPERSERLARVAEEAVAQLEEQINELSRLVNDLRPTSLERLGLAEAVEVLAKQLAARHGFDIEANVEVADTLTGEEERVVYRLVQEALNNVAKHAAAATARVDARLAGREVHVSVTDDGKGFDTSAAGRGHGLTGMRERVEMLGGDLEVHSAASTGTRIVARIPLRPS